MSGLYLEKRVAEDLAKACDDLISLFRSLSDDANYLGQVGGFGTLGSAGHCRLSSRKRRLAARMRSSMCWRVISRSWRQCRLSFKPASTTHWIRSRRTSRL